MNRKKAYKTLLKARMFSLDRVGIAGQTPETVEAFRFLLADPLGPQSFKQLLEEGSLPGQVYALAGIYLTDPPSFHEAAARFEDNAQMLETAFGGCVISCSSVRDLVRMISDGEIAENLRTAWGAQLPSRPMR